MSIAPDSVATVEVQYFVLADRASPFLLARVRWPDVAQAITAGCRDWQDDPGLFDLPYDAGSAKVTLVQATAIAAGWGASLPSDSTVPSPIPPLIRRMPANWSNLSPAEKRAWSLEFVFARRRADARREKARKRRGLGSWRGRGRSRVLERRHDPRVLIGGRARIRVAGKIVAADLVDISHGGMHCVVLESPAVIEAGTKLASPVVFKGVTPSEIRLDVGGIVTWNNDAGPGTHFGVAFDQLDEEQTDRVRRLLATSGAERDS